VPPPTITDITAILDRQKPDPVAIDKIHSAADATFPPGIGERALVRFLYDRADARSLLGRQVEAIADIDSALKLKSYLDPKEICYLLWSKGVDTAYQGDAKGTLQAFLALAHYADQPGVRGWLFTSYKWIAQRLIAMGDLRQAESYVGRAKALFAESQSWPKHRAGWSAQVELATALLYEAKGQYREAEAAYHRAELARRKAMTETPGGSQLLQGAHGAHMGELSLDSLVVDQARMKLRLGRLSEAEVDVRRALLSRLTAVGKYGIGTPGIVNDLAYVLIEQGRINEAEQLIRTALEIHRSIGVARDSQPVVSTLAKLAAVLQLEERYQEASEIFQEIDAATLSWDSARRDQLLLTGYRIYTLYETGHMDAGIEAARSLLARNSARFGEKHYNTALAHGFLAVGLARNGHDVEAVREFTAAIPILLSASHESDRDDSGPLPARDRRLRGIVETYIALLARTQVDFSAARAAEAFRVADEIRLRSVQQAILASGARAVVNDPRLAELVRREQDLRGQITAQLLVLNNALALPSEERDDKAAQQLSADIDQLKADLSKARQDIARKFPHYSDWIDPKPATLDDIKAALRPGEALLSFYLSRRGNFVWAIPKDGSVAFAEIDAPINDIARRVRLLRKTLDPQARIPFDLSAAYRLYSLLLRPVESGWQSAQSLIVVANGPLGLLPLSVLPTAEAQSDPGGQSQFAPYREVPWLARSHAITVLPSAFSLKVLRDLPTDSRANEPYIGFGDPLLNGDPTRFMQDADDARLAREKRCPTIVPEVVTSSADGPSVTRDSIRSGNGAADLADLRSWAPLPETADELCDVAENLGVDPATHLYIGARATETEVKRLSADGALAKYRIVHFATHGAVADQLPGMSEPGLILTPPEKQTEIDDGYLSASEIGALKLDAEWVILSACNTAAGGSQGAEALSGLARAFFYAGARSLLVSHWQVASDSTVKLITKAIAELKADPNIGRAEALRRSMLAIIDTGKDYEAHPAFWAPFVLVGEGGAGR
jgi:CHAT domain-containing protein/tetratricopeptide (TPR) repeat protein